MNQYEKKLFHNNDDRTIIAPIWLLSDLFYELPRVDMTINQTAQAKLNSCQIGINP